jgi:hypothetical protein
MHLRRIAPALALAAALGCRSMDSSRVVAAELAGAKTPAEEARLFDRMSHAGKPLGFAPFDGNGQRVEMSEPAWWEKTHRLVITYDEQRIDHVLLEKKNVFALMRE